MAHRFLATFRRRPFTALSILSLLLCLATVALWVRSYWRYDEVGLFDAHDTIARTWAIHSVLGQLDLRARREQLDPPLQRKREWHHYGSHLSDNTQTLSAFQAALPGGSLAHSFLGFGLVDDNIWGERVIIVPHWFLALLFAILPAFYLRAAIRSRRAQRVGLCPRCGYDLRASPERCPECGSEAASTRVA